MVELSNKARVGEVFDLLAQGLEPFVARHMQRTAPKGSNWADHYVATSKYADREYSTSDPAFLLNVIIDCWRGVFERQLPRSTKNLLFTLRDKRNDWAHNRAIGPNEAQFTLSGIVTLLETIDSPTVAGARSSLDELNRSLVTRDIEKIEPQGAKGEMVTAPQSGLRPWRDRESQSRYRSVDDVASGTAATARVEPAETSRDPFALRQQEYRDGPGLDLEAMSVTDLLALSAAAVGELRTRGVVRTGNAPLGDYVEWLAWNALGGELAPNSERSFDLTTATGRRVQVKSRRISNPPQAGQLQTSPFRSWGFDEALFVLVDDITYEVRRASMVPMKVVQDFSRYVAHVNGSHAYMTDDLMGHEQAQDLTNELRVTLGHDPIDPLNIPAPRPIRGEPLRTNRQPRRRTTTTTLKIAPKEAERWGNFGPDVVEEFRSWKVEGGATERSAGSYVSGARAFIDYCRTIGDDDDPIPFEQHLAEARGMTPNSITGYATYARSFVSFLRERDGSV